MRRTQFFHGRLGALFLMVVALGVAFGARPALAQHAPPSVPKLDAHSSPSPEVPPVNDKPAGGEAEGDGYQPVKPFSPAPFTPAGPAAAPPKKWQPPTGIAVPAKPVPLDLPPSSGGDHSGVSSQAISVPQGAGKIQGMGESFSAQLSTGIGTFSVPFSLLPSRGAASPSLSLSYSSSGGHGLAGVGWDMSWPSISRQTDRGLPKYNEVSGAFSPDQDRFVFNGGQELVPICVVGGSLSCAGMLTGEVMPSWASGWMYFRPRVEGSFLRFFWSPDHRTWVVQDKAGVSMELGVPMDGLGDTGALETDPTNSTHIFRWNLARQGDPFTEPAQPFAYKNPVVYAYTHDGGVAYLTDIFDTPPAAKSAGAPTSSFAHHTRVRYEKRPDVTSSYRRGWLTTQGLRLVGVDVTAKPFHTATGARRAVRRYHLAYEPDFHVSLLASVQLEGRCGTPASAVEYPDDVAGTPEDGSATLPASTGCPVLPPMTFGYQHVKPFALDGTAGGADLVGYEGFDEHLHDLASSPPWSVDDGKTGLFDINADALPDVLVAAPGSFAGDFGVYFQGQHGASDTLWPTTISISGVNGDDSTSLQFSNSNVNPLDLDGDGVIDLLHMPKVKTYSVYTPRRVSGGATQDVAADAKWTWDGRSITTAASQSQKIDFSTDAANAKVMDVNGDGLVDVVISQGTEYQTFFSLGRYAGGDGRFGFGSWVAPASASLDTTPVESCVPWAGSVVQLGDPDVRIADMNGDGYPDIVRVRQGDVRYWPGRGNGVWGTGPLGSCGPGTFATGYVSMALSPWYSDIDTSGLRLDDVNGDGLDDLVQVRFQAVDIWLNVDGSGYTPNRHIIAGTPSAPGFQNRVRLADINGSGSRDILWGDGEHYRYIDLQGGERPWILTHVENGMGKTTDLEYASSVSLMLSAAEAKNPWKSVTPMPLHVVTKVTERDHLQVGGHAPGVYTTSYTYRDPVYDGRQREFRGFHEASVRREGDANSPSSTSHTTFLLGECKNDEGVASALDPCTTENRWQDNHREALKGLPVESDTSDDSGVYLSTEHKTYTLRKLYVGLDGREVRHAFESQVDSWRYDTAAWKPSSASIPVDDVVLELKPGTPTPDLAGSTPSPTIVRRATTGTAHVGSKHVVDTFGNASKGIALGCIEGDGCVQANGAIGVDEQITTATLPALIASPSGWLWRTVETWIEGSSPAHAGDKRKHTFTTYDSKGEGQPVLVEGDFHRTNISQDIMWFHETTGAKIATVSSAVTAYDGSKTFVSATEYDDFGNPLWQASAAGRCRSMVYDEVYRDLVVSESVYVGGVGSGGPCGTKAGGIKSPLATRGGIALTAEADYDRGLLAPTLVHDIHNEPTLAGYDGFGRLTSLTRPDPELDTKSGQPQLSAVPSLLVDYHVTTDPAGQPFSLVRTQTQDGATSSTKSYAESWAYVDGLGRTLLTLRQADPAAGDGGAWIVDGLTGYDTKGAPERAYRSWFWTGDPSAYPVNQAPPSPYGRQRYDGFGRQVEKYHLDGSITLRTAYHAQSTDAYDAADLATGPHHGTYASTREDGHGRDVATTERAHVGGKIETRENQIAYLPSGTVETITRTRPSGGAPVVRWMRYDSQDRLLLNMEPNTSSTYTSKVDAQDVGLKAWRYAWDDAGQLIATSDARGCGSQYEYDAAGRLLAEDYSPCLAIHPVYSDPGDGVDNYEVRYTYDAAESANDDSGCDIQETFLLGRLTAIRDRGAHARFGIDGRGRISCVARQVAKPMTELLDPSSLTGRYATRWYHQSTGFDGADRIVYDETGSTVQILKGVDLKGAAQISYSKRGSIRTVGGSFGVLVSNVVHDADGLVTHLEYGDLAKTVTDYGFDTRRRLSTVQTYRGPPPEWSSAGYPGAPVMPGGPPSFQLVLEDLVYKYDVSDNPTEIRDYRSKNEWPAGAQPVSRKIEYDDLYRVTRVDYEYPTGVDSWTSPYEFENNNPPTSTGPYLERPSPHGTFDARSLWQATQYDWLGNSVASDDDAHGFYDRSLGTIANAAGPYQLTSATNGKKGDGPKTGSLSTTYDASGNLLALSVRRNGACAPTGSACGQNYSYEWDELGRLSRAVRFDVSDSEGSISFLAADLRYAYDAHDQRVLKESVSGGATANGGRFSVYVFDSLELRRAAYGYTDVQKDLFVDDYEDSGDTESLCLMANGARLGRVNADLHGAPTISGVQVHILLEMADHLGSTSKVIDRETGELVEASTYLPTGAPDSDFRPARWMGFREPYRQSGHEEDIEVGLSYAGRRYSSPYLGRWISPDPQETHAPGSADLNLYALVRGRLLASVDPLGLADEPASPSFLSSVGSAIKARVDGLAVSVAAPIVLGIATVQGDKQGQADALRSMAGSFASATPVGMAYNVGQGALEQGKRIGNFIGSLAGGDAEGAREAGAELVTDGLQIAVTVLVTKSAVSAAEGTTALRPRAPTRSSAPSTPARASRAPAPSAASEVAAKTSQDATACSGRTCTGTTCFVAGTSVWTPVGLVAIEALGVGDVVYCAPEDGSASVATTCAIEATYQRTADALVELTLESFGEDLVETIRTTPDHPFWVADHGWVTAGALWRGATLWQAENALLRVRGTALLTSRSDVFNLRVAAAHTYFVGQSGAWVHNADCGGKGPIQAGEHTTYQDFADRSVVGDNLEGHELWQHSNLNEKGLATSRLSTPASKQNPVIALEREVHSRVNAAQRGLDARSMKAVDNIKANAEILRSQAAAPAAAIDAAESAALKHAESLGHGDK